MPPRCAACLTKVRTDHALRLVQEIVAEDFFLRLFRQSRECSGKGDVAEQDGLAADDKGVFFVRLRLGKLDKLLICQIVKGNFPFTSMQIESGYSKNEIDFTKATVTGDKKILISSPLDVNTKESYVKLFKASTSNYRDLIKHIELTGGSNPICVVYNAIPVSADPTTTEIYAFSAPNLYTVHVKYYTGKDEKDPFYEEYLLNLNDGNRSYLGNISLPDGKDCKVWRYKENSNRNGTATDVKKTVNELVNGELYPTGAVPEIELYAGYSVSIDASVS